MLKKTSKYNQLNNDEKWNCFNSFHDGFPDDAWESNDVRDDVIKKLKLEAKGYELLENFIISNGGTECYPPYCYFKKGPTGSAYTELLGNVHEKTLIRAWNTIEDNVFWNNIGGFTFLATGMDWTGFSSYSYESKYKNGTIFKSKNITLVCFNNVFEITKVRVDINLRKLKKSLFDFSSSKTVSLLPFHGFGHKNENIWLKESVPGIKYGLEYKPVDFWKFIENKEYNNYKFKKEEILLLNNLYQILDNYVTEVYQALIELPKLKKKKEKKSVKSKIRKVISENFDKNNNGQLDILEGDNLVIDLLDKNESIIIDFDHKIIQDIVKLNEFLNIKRENLIKMFEFLKKIETKNEMDDVLKIFKLSVDNYQSLLIHSISMIISVKEKKLSTYYEIRNCFDKLNIFNSNWENEVSKKLTQIDSKMSQMIISLEKLISTVRSFEITTRESLNKLSYITKSSFKNLQNSVTKELSSIRGGVGLNNLLTGINTYQLYTLNKNTKSLKS